MLQDGLIDALTKLFLLGAALKLLMLGIGLSLLLGLLKRALRRSGSARRTARKPVKPTTTRAATDAATEDPIAGHIGDPKVQMELVARAAFQTTPLLNKEEYRLLPILEAAVRELGQGHRVTMQTALGEVIRARDPDRDTARRAHSAINSKRLDFGIVDRSGILRLAVEYQGSGHYNDRAFMRDAVKKEALRKAGVPMLEVRLDFCRDRLRDDVLTALAPRQQAPGPRPRPARRPNAFAPAHK